MNATKLFFLTSMVVLCALFESSAAPIFFENPVLIADSIAGETVEGTGDVTPEGVDNPEAWDFWLLAGNAGDKVRVTVLREVSELDPVFGVWDGVDFDTDDYVDMFSDSDEHTLLTVGDDELPPSVPGPFGDATAVVEFTSPGLYVVAVADFGAEPNPVMPELPYTIIVERIPEPTSACLALLAFSSVCVVRRRF